MMEKRFKSIEDNIKRIRMEIEETAISAGRDPREIQLMAVTKTQAPELVNKAIECGITLLGENRAQELLEKYEHYHLDSGVDVHFIGALQSNKVRQIIDKVSMIHSVDSLKLAEEIDRRAARLEKTMDVLMEVNIGDEASKAGIEPEQVEELARQIAAMGHLRLRGLMAIPPICDSEAQVETYFSRMRQLQVDIKGKNIDNVPMDVLSMGMSGDYLAAVKHGATILRLGSAIFGARTY